MRDDETPGRPRVVPPAHDLDGEATLIATASFDPSCIPSLQRLVRADELYMSEHQEILAAIYSVYDAGVEVEPSTVTAWMYDHCRLAHAGGKDRVVHLFDHTLPTSAPEELARRLAKLAAVRRVDFSSRRIAAEARAPIEDLDEWLIKSSEAVRTAADVTRLLSRDPVATSREVVMDVHGDLMERARKYEAGEESEPGISTGYSLLDYRIGRLQPGGLHIIGAEPNVGKTGLGLAIGCNVGRRGIGVAFSTLEVPREELVERALAMYSGVTTDDLFRGSLDANAHRYLTDAMAALAAMPVVFDDASVQTLSTLRSFVRAAAERTKTRIRVLVVDYLQLMGVDLENPRANDNEIIAHNSRGLLALAKDLDLAVLAMAQFNRDRKHRGKGELPVVTDLYGSSQIEKDSRAILLLHEQSEKGADPSDIIGIMAKGRRGSHPGKVPFQQRRSTSRWFEMAKEYDYDPPPTRGRPLPDVGDDGFSDGFGEP